MIFVFSTMQPFIPMDLNICVTIAIPIETRKKNKPKQFDELYY